MAQELELSDYTNIHEFQGFNGTEKKDTSRNNEQSGRRLLRMGILTLGVLCIIQATLNISLRLAFYSKQDIDEFPFNISVMADLSRIDQSQQNSTQLCSCCNNVLRRLLKEYQNLKTERDFLQEKVSQLSQSRTTSYNYSQYYDFDYGSGSGYAEME